MTVDAMRFFDRMPQILPLYEKLEEGIREIYDPVEIRVQKTQITFKNRYNFAFASLPMRKMKEWPDTYLLVSFGLSYELKSPRVAVATEAYRNRWTHHVIVQTEQEIDEELMGWIKEASDFSMSK